MTSEPLVSVIILGWGGERYIRACLNALRRQTYDKVEVVVVDNHSPDQTAEIVESDFPEVKLIRTERNLGVAGGNNVGLHAARGEILILINADVEVHPDWLEHLVRAVNDDSSIGIAGAKLLYPDGTIQFAGGRIDGPRGYTYHLGWHEPDQGQWDHLTEVDFITGACLAITRKALERIGPEDEKFFPIDYEDPDLSYRARRAGFRVVVVPKAVAIHAESSTAKAADRRRVLALEAGRLRFVCKHWSADRLLNEFLPAELNFLRERSPLNESVLKWVYAKSLREVHDLANWREQLGVGGRSESVITLTGILTQLRRSCVPRTAELAAVDDLLPILDVWFAPNRGDPPSVSHDLFLSLCKMQEQVESHLPIGWPHWPRGLWPKIVVLAQKMIRRSLRWYIDPLVQQQNTINAAFLQALQTLAQEMTALQDRRADAIPPKGPDPGQIRD